MIFIKINSFLNKIGPLWAHKGLYGPIRAHMGPNPDRAPTRTEPQPGLGPNPGPGRFCSDSGFLLNLHASGTYGSV